EGGAELLYTMSGAPAEAFARFGLPRNAPLFNASAGLGAGEGGIRLDDVTKDPQYGQWGAPPGARPGQLPITSYLAAPLTSRDGTVMGALVFGHSQPGRFTAHHERMLKTLAITAAVSMENANLFSATREADEKHRRSIADLTETVRMNELFAGVLAHDLRNPLASIMTAAQVTLTRTADERLTKPMNRILKSGDRMLRMIEQLLDFTRIRVGNGMPINSRELDLVPLLRQVADELKAGAADARITIQGTGDTNGGWDGDRLAQVFSNLLGNALHHGQPDPDGNSAVTVDVQVDGRDGDSVQVLVHNAGTIPAGTRPNLFEPFGSRDRHAERTRGLGLGLFITREIVRAHGGSVRVESSESAGTTFSVSLPRFALAVQPPADLPQSRSLQEAQEQLRGSEERIRMLVETVRDYAIFMLDPTGRVQTWNAGAERIKGYRASEIIGQHFSIFYDPELIRAGACQRELEVAARDGRFEEEGWRLRKDGSRFWASVVITALRHPRGELLGFAKVTRDLTDRRKAEAERIRLAHAQESIRLRDEFLSIVSHELKTPLAGLQLQLENLQRRLDMSDQMTATQLRRATESGQRLASLIESLLDASRIATGRLVLAPQRFDLAEAVRQVIATVEPAATKAGCTLITRLESPVQGTWDRDRVQQAVTNLLLNGIKYAAGSEIEISLSRTPSGGEQGSNSDEVIVQVTDHGPGVPVEDLARIFGRFERAVPIQHHGGLGLGLYVVGEIASAHGGSVTAENLPEGGARFVLRLPLNLPVPAPLLGHHAQTASPALRRGSH
ncbi:MAG: ATP-binding protein, partial [Myxococcales bacterium]